MERFTQKGLQMDRQAPLSLRGGRIPMVFENTLRRIVEEIGPGMADEELCALKQTMLTLLDFDSVPAQEDDDGDEKSFDDVFDHNLPNCAPPLSCGGASSYLSTISETL